MFYTRNRGGETPPTQIWRQFDELIVKQIADDVILIEQHGRPEEFSVYVAQQMREQFGTGGFTDEFMAADELDYGQYFPGEHLAKRILPVGHGTIDAVLQWHRHRQRLRFVAGLIRAEAEAIRDGLQRLQNEELVRDQNDLRHRGGAHGKKKVGNQNDDRQVRQNAVLVRAEMNTTTATGATV